MKQGGFYKMSMRDVPLDGKVVLVRADYNVPQESGAIKDDYRIRSSIPTIEALLARGCTVVLMAHLGRPGGKVAPELSLSPVAQRLRELLGRSVRFVDDCIGDKVVTAIKHAGKGSVLLLENVRFYPGDETNDRVFARDLAQSSQASYFVEDGFGVAHRAQASTSAITEFLPSVAGLLLEKEYMTITHAMKDPKRPLVAVLGGAKISDKIQLVEKFVEISDTVIIGGAMANNFLQEKGFPVGKSLVKQGAERVVRDIEAAVAKKVGLDEAEDFFILPTDVAVAKDLSAQAERVEKSARDVDQDDIILDIGSKTMARIEHVLASAGTVIWNGTLGRAEVPQFAHGSARLALFLATHKTAITSVVGGGDTADFVLHWDAAHGDSFGLVSTGGGASLELMAGKKLPGIEVLMDAR